MLVAFFLKFQTSILKFCFAYWIYCSSKR